MSRQRILGIVTLLCASAVIPLGCSSSTTPFDASTSDVATGADSVVDAGAPSDTPVGSDALQHPDTTLPDVNLTDATTPTDAPAQPDVQDASTTPDVPVATDVVTPADVPVATDTGTPTDAPASEAGVPCTSTAGCASGQRCGFSIAQACAATGSCVEIPTPLPCGAIELLQGCSCTGTAVMWTGGCAPQFPSGYAPAAIAHMGTCP